MSFLMAAGYKLEPRGAADEQLVEYFARETAKVEAACLADVRTLSDWNAKREGYRKELFEMLGLSPLPERTSRTLSNPIDCSPLLMVVPCGSLTTGLSVTKTSARKVMSAPGSARQ